MSQARLRFHGAAREVTGSMHLLEINGYTLALDCGLFQGKRALANEKNRARPYDSRDIDAVVLSHAHIDHCGKLPLLVRQGFKGRIHCTPPTRALAAIMLADSAHVQKEDAEYWNKKRVRRGDPPIDPLYTDADVAAATGRFVSHGLDETFEVVPGARARFHEAGHMLGSAGVRLELDAGGPRPTRLTFTGDLGRSGIPILRDPAPLPECDYLISESTYGGRVTPDPVDLPGQFAEVINETAARGGKLIIPSFAVGRSQAVVYYYHLLLEAGRIRRPIPMVVDSPLASAATQVYRNSTDVFDHEAEALIDKVGALFDFQSVRHIEDVEDSKRLHEEAGPMIIVSASGMCEAGRILHHLKNNIEDPRNTVLIVGYQAADTLGRRLVEKARQVKIFGETYSVRAQVKVLNGFSSHANAKELRAALRPLAKTCRHAFLVHGEPDQSEVLAAAMRQDGFREVTAPAPGEVFELSA
ncbi:MAG: MBL fold metallo-hydrolase [Phycisphaerae bacterium]|jgi:metallo-beta-lactamase family protein